MVSLFVILIGASIIWQSNKRLSDSRKIFRYMTAIGIFCFFAAFVLPTFGNLLRWVEFPAIYQTKTIKSSDGRFYSATIPLQRIQRYSSKGEFELGWFVEAGGGSFAIGLTKDGNIVSASARAKLVQVFSPDGTLKQRPIKYVTGFGISTFEGILVPKELKFIGISLVESSAVKNPELSVWAAFLFLFAHPFIPWLLAVIGTTAAYTDRFLNSAK